MNFLDDQKNEEEYENINWTILYDNVMNMSLVILKCDYGAIDADYSTCTGCYIIKFSSYPYHFKHTWV